jgi:hypothetical protein
MTGIPRGRFSVEPGLGIPDTPNWRSLWIQRVSMDFVSQVKALGLGEVFHSIHSRGFLALVILGNPSYGKQTGIPGSHQKPL